MTPSFTDGVLFFMATSFSFGKKEKLKSRKHLDELFAAGKSFAVFPIKIFYAEVKANIDFQVKVGVGATKRNFKKSVDRNKVKRLLREAYRVNKQPLLDFANEKKKNVSVFFLLIDRTIPDLQLLNNKMPLIIEKLKSKLSETADANA